MSIDPNIAATIGARMRTLRLQKEMSQDEVAVAMGISRSYYSALENGKKRQQLDELVSFARLFSIPISSLFESATILSEPSVTLYESGPRNQSVQVQEPASRYGTSPYELIASKNETITALKAEIQALRELIEQLKLQLKS